MKIKKLRYLCAIIIISSVCFIYKVDQILTMELLRNNCQIIANCILPAQAQDLPQIEKQLPSSSVSLYDNHDAKIINPKRLIFVCCQDERRVSSPHNFETRIDNDTVVSRPVYRYTSHQTRKTCDSPMSYNRLDKQLFLDRVKTETEGTEGAYFISQTAFSKDDEEIWNIEVDSMLQGEGTVSDAIKARYALQEKDKLHNIFTRLGFDTYVPKQYDFPRVLPDQYPVIVKRTKGSYGLGVHIVRSAVELNETLRTDRAHLQKREMKKQAGVEYLVQEAIVNTTENVLHYIRTPTGYPGKGWTKVWCGIYSHRSWVDKEGLRIQGYKTKNLRLMRTQCDDRVVQPVLVVMKDQDVSGFGCLDYKYLKTQPKIFDWNMRHCGSQRRKVIIELLAEPPVKTH